MLISFLLSAIIIIAIDTSGSYCAYLFHCFELLDGIRNEKEIIQRAEDVTYLWQILIQRYSDVLLFSL